jgi:hypothetical protein
MSSLRDLVKGAGDEPAMLAKAIPELISACPLVGEMLCGVAAKGNEPAIPKYFLSFSLESDGMVCRCSQKGSDESLYVKIEDALTAWMALENALGNGKFTRRRDTKQKPSY